MSNESIDKTTLEAKAEQITEARVGKINPEHDTTQMSPMEKVEKLNIETAKNLEELRKETARIENIMANLTLSGNSLAGQPPKEPSKDDLLDAEAKRYLKALRLVS